MLYVISDLLPQYIQNIFFKVSGLTQDSCRNLLRYLPCSSTVLCKHYFWRTSADWKLRLMAVYPNRSIFWFSSFPFYKLCYRLCSQLLLLLLLVSSLLPALLLGDLMFHSCWIALSYLEMKFKCFFFLHRVIFVMPWSSPLWDTELLLSCI